MKAADIRYIVNEDKRTVVALLEDCEYDAYDDIMKHGHYCNVSLSASVRANNILMPSVIRAVAKCHPSDEFDPEEGKKRARRKLIKHYYKLKANIITQHIVDLERVADRLISYVGKIYNEELIEK